MRSAGHGIGLNIVRRLAERFGWEIGFASKLNAGTTVSVRFSNAHLTED